MKYIVELAIGPVQGFIAAGRKTRDLWYGSWLLSECAREAARKLPADGLIFPHDDAVPRSDQAIPNKIVGVVQAEDETSVRAILTEAAQAAIDRLLSEAKTVIHGPDIAACHGAVDTSRIETQAKTFLETYAAWIAWSGRDEDYAAALRRLDIEMAARKSTRQFVQPDGAFVPKSSLDSSRETVLADARTVPSAERFRRRTFLKPGEQLDGVSLVKRLATTERFVSVSRIAVDPWLRALPPAVLAVLNVQAQRLRGSGLVESFSSIDAALKQFVAFPYDTQLWYGRSKEEDDLLSGASEADRKRWADAITAFRGALKGLPAAPVYLAVLVADGDSMGAGIRELATPEAHRRFSSELSGFARTAAEAVAESHGALVYAGGDDVLALLPVNSAIACAERLRNDFAGATANGGMSRTLSAGIAIGHYHEEFLDLLSWARSAEHAAKKHPGKNALAVALHTRTGGATSRTAVRSWNDEPAKDWARWVSWHISGEVPDGLAYELANLARELAPDWPLAGESAWSSADAERVLEPEVARVLGRKRRSDESHLAKDTIARLTERVTSGTGGATLRDVVKGLETVAVELIIARRLAEAERVAGGATP